MSDKPKYNTTLNDLIESLTGLLAPLQDSSTIELDNTAIYWKVGLHIQHHIDAHFDKQNYSAYLFSTLPQVLEVSRDILYHCVKFYKMYPQFNPVSNNIGWSHYKILMSIKSPDERKTYEQIVADKKINVSDLITMIRKKDENLFTLERSQLPALSEFPHICRIRQIAGTHCLDLGFYTYSDLTEEDGVTFVPDSLVQITHDDHEYRFKPYSGDKAFLFTYKATLDRVVDGDTVRLLVDLGFHTKSYQILRLRGINAPVLKDPRGRKAKDFIMEVLMHPDIHIAIKTFSRDRYARFITDLYYSTTESDPIKIINSGHYLNLELLENKLVDPYLGG